MPDLSLLLATVTEAKAAPIATPSQACAVLTSAPAATATSSSPATAPLAQSPETSAPCPEFVPASRPASPELSRQLSRPVSVRPTHTQPTSTRPTSTRPTAPNPTPAPTTAAAPALPPMPIAPPSEPNLPDILPTVAATAPNPYLPQPEIKPLQPTWANYVRPRSGSQQYRQRLEALRQGKTYTRLPSDSFSNVWANATQQPTYEQWVALLQREATSMAKGQGRNRLTVMLGDSISQWFPTEQLSSDRFYLNQGISGDTTAGVLNRLAALDQVRPDRIYVMVGVNDLKNSKTDEEILANLKKIMERLQQAHPQAQVIINSVLPTRWATIPGDRTTALNTKIAQLSQQEGVGYLALDDYFMDNEGTLSHELTTDGLHLSAKGYVVWGQVLRSVDATLTAQAQAQ